MFRFYSNAVSNASKSIAAGIFVFALMLIGFGVLILALPELFAMLAAIVFFIAGIGCIGTAVKIYLVQKQIDNITGGDMDDGRENVRIHIEGREDEF